MSLPRGRHREEFAAQSFPSAEFLLRRIRLLSVIFCPSPGLKRDSGAAACVDYHSIPKPFSSSKLKLQLSLQARGVIYSLVLIRSSQWKVSPPLSWLCENDPVRVGSQIRLDYFRLGATPRWAQTWTCRWEQAALNYGKATRFFEAFVAHGKKVLQLLTLASRKAAQKLATKGFLSTGGENKACRRRMGLIIKILRNKCRAWRQVYSLARVILKSFAVSWSQTSSPRPVFSLQREVQIVVRYFYYYMSELSSPLI